MLYRDPEEFFSDLVGGETEGEQIAISSESLEDFSDMVSDLELCLERARQKKGSGVVFFVKELTRFLREAGEDFSEIIEERLSNGEFSQSYKEGLEFGVEMIYGLGSVLERSVLRRELSQKYLTASKKERKIIAARIDEINIQDAYWQHQAIAWVLILGGEGRDILARFWNSLEKAFHYTNPHLSSSKAEFSEGVAQGRGLRFGVLGAVGLLNILEKISARGVLPTPEQDALGKIDLWILPQGRDWREGFLGVQIKTSINGLRGIAAEKLSWERVKGMAEFKKQKELKKMLTFLQRYSKVFDLNIIPVRVDLVGAQDQIQELIDPITGEIINANDPYIRKEIKRFAVFLANCCKEEESG